MALLLVVFNGENANAADWSLVPSMNLRSEFNTNLNYDFKNPKSDYLFTVQYASEYNYATEVLQLQGRLGLTGLHYITNSSADHIDQSYQINGKYALTPRCNFILNSAYIVDSSLQEELSTSGVIMTRTPRQSIAAGPGLAYNLTESLMATVNYNFNRVMYQDPQFRNYTNHQVGLRLDYLLSNEKSTLIGNVLARESLYPGNDSYKSLGFYAGINHKFSERWEVNLMAGANYSLMDFATQVLDFSQAPYFILVKTVRARSTEVTPYLSLSTTGRWTKWTLTASFSRDQSASAYGAISEVYQGNLSAKYNFTERLAGTLTAGYSKSSQAGKNSTYKSEYYNVGPQLTYQVTEKLSVSPGYKYGQRNDITGSRSANAHSVWAMLTYTYPIHYQK